jgi:hypothetical protein
MTSAETTCIRDHLVTATDQLGESIAWMHQRGQADPCFDNVLDAFTTLWLLRAELGFVASKSASDAEQPEAAQ